MMPLRTDTSGRFSGRERRGVEAVRELLRARRGVAAPARSVTEATRRALARTASDRTPLPPSAR